MRRLVVGIGSIVCLQKHEKVIVLSFMNRTEVSFHRKTFDRFPKSRHTSKCIVNTAGEDLED